MTFLFRMVYHFGECYAKPKVDATKIQCKIQIQNHLSCQLVTMGTFKIEFSLAVRIQIFERMRKKRRRRMPINIYYMDSSADLHAEKQRPILYEIHTFYFLCATIILFTKSPKWKLYQHLQWASPIE